jgi:DNA processing protein
MDNRVRRATAALWSIPGIGPVTLREIRSRFSNLGDLLDVPVQEWSTLVPWKSQAKANVERLEFLSARADWLESQCLRSHMAVLFSGDPAWPSRLDAMYDAPPLLFVRGRAAAGSPRPRLAIVGTRNPDAGSVARLQAISGEAAAAGLGIISGAAIGIDQAAHRGALEVGGETWAFLGSALDQVDSPQRHIVNQILEGGGTVLSEFPPGFRSNASSFKLRNRLIAGASDAVLVFRAGLPSGALYTAEAALVQKKPLLATPGDPWNAAAVGTNQLLREGKAVPHLDVGDLLNAVGVSSSCVQMQEFEIDLSLLSEKGAAVLHVLGRGASDFEGMLASLPSFSSGQLSAALVELEVVGAVVQKGGRRYEKR